MSLQDEAESFLCDTMRMRFPGREGTFFGAFWVGEPVRFPGRWDVDQGPLEGTVWQVTERWVILEAGESLYVVCARPFLDRAPELGATVRIKTYRRRGFDGLPLRRGLRISPVGEMTQREDAGISRLPVDRASLKSERLKDLIEQVERSIAPDGVRRLAQVLIDAGADRGPVGFVDPGEETPEPALLRFRVHSKKVQGFLELSHSGSSGYRIRCLGENGEVIAEREGVPASNLTGEVVGLVDDGLWRVAKVETLSPPPILKEEMGIVL
jgi:hypothetical protein